MEAVKTIKGYELHERIGSGGFGVVYRAAQTTIGREVALKIILPHFANQPNFIRRFETEAQIIARLEHLHIVPLYDYWRDPDGAYLVMRWLRGGNLRDALANGSFDLEATALFLDQITSALAMAHRNGVIHRDLKPANILLDEEGNAYLSDFGIAKDTRTLEGALTGTGMVLGSPDYLSPEQARSEPVTPQTDIYSLGVMLYEVLAGHHPFPNGSPVERMYKHLNEPLPLIETLPAEVVEGVNAIIQQATAKNPAQRYSNVLALAVDFRRETALSQRQAENVVERLTFREQEILQMIMEGCSNKEIAQRLFVTTATVKWHIHGVYQKLHVRSRVQAIVRARELNLIVAESAIESRTGEATYITLPEPENPYKGLRAFQMADARDFFGRERLVRRLIKQLGEHHKLARFLAVVGPSGSGKSSVVKAGLVPALWHGDLPGSEQWFVVEMIPGSHPLDELEIALTRIAANQASNLHEQLERDARGLVRVANLILPDDGSELVLIVDQFEEIFTLVEDELKRAQFLDLLYTAVTDPRSRVRVIITLRADFYDRPLHYPDFGELVRSRMETVMPLSADELEEAITKPAAQVGVSFESGLVATITGDVHYQPGALPLLQYALTELFEQLADHILTHDSYQALGGATGALAKRAEEVYHEQDDIGQEIIRQMFLRLVTVGEGSEETRRRVPRSELLAVASNEDLMDEAIDTYAAYRLLTLDHDPATRRPTVEIAHEAILSEWERLRSWLSESRHDIRQQSLLAAAAAEWLRAGSEKSYLLRGARLDQFEEWMGQMGIALTPDETTYLEASVTERAQQTQLEYEQQAREAKLKQRMQRGFQLLAGVFLIAAVIAAGLAIIAFDQRATARKERDNALRQAEVNHSLVLANEAVKVDETLGLMLAVEAASIDQPPAEVVSTLSSLALNVGTRAILREQGNAIKTVVFSPDSKLALSGGCADLIEDVCSQGELILWDLEAQTKLRQFEGHTDWVNSAAFSPDGLTAISGSSDKTLILWDVETGQILRRFEGHTGAINSMVFALDGKTIISGSDDSTLLQWDVTTGEIVQRFEGHIGPVTEVALSPDGQILASGSADTTAITWKIETGEIIRRFSRHSAAIDLLAFIPGTETIISGSALTLLVWNAKTGDVARADQDRTGTAVNISFSHDGSSVWLCSGGESAQYDIEKWRMLGNVTNRRVSVSSCTLSPDERFALTGYVDGLLRLSNMPMSNPEVHRSEAEVPLASADLSPDGRYLLTGACAGGGAILWDVKTGQEIRRFEGQEDCVVDVNFSPDGRKAALASADWWGTTRARKLVLVDIETGKELHQLVGHKFGVRAAAFSPDGRYLLAGSLEWGSAWEEQGGGDLILWDVETGQLVRRFEMTDAIFGVDFSPDGRFAVTGGIFNPHVAVWDVTTGRLIRRLERFERGAVSTRWNPDGKTIFVNMMLVDPTTGDVIRRFGAISELLGAADFSPDGHYVVGGDNQGNIILWDLQTGEELYHFTAYASGASLYDIVFSPDGQTFFTASMTESAVIQWRIVDWPLDKLLAWVHENRYLREFTCEERILYRIEPLCEAGDNQKRSDQ